MSTSNTVFSVISFIAFFLVLMPLPWHMKAWNTGTSLYGVWTALSLLAYCINSIIWNNDTINRAPVWCDISIRLISSSWVGITAASMCINRGLYNITTLQTISWSKAQKRRTVMIDLAVGVGIPAIMVVFLYIVQTSRFAIVQEIGCCGDTANTPLTLVLFEGPPAVLSLVSIFYAVRSVIVRRRTEENLKKHLFSASGFNVGVWYRLLALASIEICVALPYTLFLVISHVTTDHQSFRPWISWDDTHLKISSVEEIPSSLWKASLGDAISLERSRWIRVFFAFSFITLFGLTSETRRHYKMVWDFFMKRIGRSSAAGRITSLRFRSFKGRDTDISVSSRADNDNHIPSESGSDMDAIYEEPLPKPPAIAPV